MASKQRNVFNDGLSYYVTDISVIAPVKYWYVLVRSCGRLIRFVKDLESVVVVGVTTGTVVVLLLQ